MIDVLLADDHTIFRSGIRRLLLDEPDMRVAAEARNGVEALELVKARSYDLVLLDINMDGRSGLEVLESIRSAAPALPVLMLSMYPEEQYALVALKSGASGYVPKDAEPAELVAAIRRVAAREHQIMLMLLKGMPLTDIGEEMMISVKTVSTHRSHILEKLGVTSTAELVLYAVRHGLVH